MSAINDKEALLSYIKEQCKLTSTSTVSDMEVEIAVKRQIVMQSAEWKQLAKELIAASFDPSAPVASGSEAEALKQRLEKFVSSTVVELEKAKIVKSADRSTPDRLITDYFLPMVYAERKASSDLLGKISEKLKLSTSSTETKELNLYKEALTAQVDYLDAVSTLPAHLEKLVGGLRSNTGKNYTPRQNAQVLTALLDTLQKGGEGIWTAEKLLEAVRLVTKVTMPDLPVDAFTLDSMQELLPVVNQVMDAGKLAETKKAELFPQDNPEQANARKALFSSVGVGFTSLPALCQATLWQPIEGLLKSVGELGAHAGLISTENGLDTIHLMRTLDKVGNVINGLPIELLPKSVQGYASSYLGVKQKIGGVASKVGEYASVGGQVVGAMGSLAVDQALAYAPESVKKGLDSAVTFAANTALRVSPYAETGVAWIDDYLTPYHYSPFTSAPLAFMTQKATVQTGGGMLWNAASRFVPSYFKNKFKKMDTETEFWQGVMPSTGGREPNTLAAYFHFHELATSSAVPGLKEEFFQSVMKQANIQADYSDYLAFEEALDVDFLKSPLSTQLETAQAKTDLERFNSIVSLVQRTKTLEREISTSKNPGSILKELDDAMKVKSTNSSDPLVASVQKLYVQPALDRALLKYEQKLFMPQLEKALDLTPKNAELRNIYSKLKAGQLLSRQDFVALKDYSTSPAIAASFIEKAVDEAHKLYPNDEQIKGIYAKLHADPKQALSPEETVAMQKRFDHPEVWFSIDEEISTLAGERAPVLSKEVPKGLTPREESHQSMQSTLEMLLPVCNHISEGLEKQLEDCKGLRALAPSGELKDLCDAKITYLQSLKDGLERFVKDIKSEDQELAEHLRRLTNGELVGDMLSAEASSIAGHMIGLAADTIMPKSGMVAASSSTKLLAYALDSTGYMKGIIKAKHGYDKVIEETPPPPELMGQLGNPLRAVKGLNEDVVRKGMEGLLQGGQAFLESFVSYYATSAALGLVFPPSLIFDVALGVATRGSFTQKVGGWLGPITTVYNSVTGALSGFVSQQVGKLAEPMKDLVCPMLGVEVQKVLEKNALDYASADPTARASLTKDKRESFTGFYLQYRAIKANNPQVDKAACVEYLFRKSLAAETNLEKRKGMVEKLSGEFENLDKQLQSDQMEVTEAFSELENQLQFLMGKIDFSNPKETELVAMTIYGQLILKQFAAAEQLSPEQATKLHDKAMFTIESVLNSLKEADNKNALAQVPGHERVEERAPQLVGATKMATKVKLDGLQKELVSISSLIDAQMRDRDDQLKADLKPEEPKRLDMNVVAAGIAKGTKISLFTKVAQGLAKIGPALIFWPTLGLAIASKGAIGGMLAAVGLAGTAGTAGIFGLALLATIVAVKITYNTIKEVRARDNEFEAINKMEASPLKKAALTFLTGVKCFLIGFAKAVLLDTAYNMLTRIFSTGIKPIVESAQSSVRDLARSHPKRSTLEDEKVILGKLKTQLAEFQKLVEEQIKDQQSVDYDPKKLDPSKFRTQKSYEARLEVYTKIQERAAKIEEMSAAISEALVDTQESLADSSKDDARWEKGVNKELVIYKTAFDKLTKAMKDVDVLAQTERRMQPEMTIHQKNALGHAKEAERQLAIVNQFATPLKAERENFEAVKNDRTALKEMAGRVRQSISDMTVAAKAADELSQNAYAEAKKSGEVGALGSLTAITGPTRAASNQAQKASESAKLVVTESEQFLKSIEAELVRNTHEIVVGHTKIVDEHLAKAFKTSEELLSKGDNWGHQALIEFQLGELEDLEGEDRDDFVEGLDYEQIEEMFEGLRVGFLVLREARRAAEEAYKKASQAITIEESGVAPGKATMVAYAKAKQDLEKAQKLEETAEEALSGIHAVMEEFTSVQKAETQLEHVNSAIERIKKEQKKFNKSPEVDYDALDDLIETVEEEFGYLSEATSKLKEIDKTVSELAATDPEWQEDSETIKESLEKAQALETEAQEVLQELLTIRALKVKEIITEDTAAMQEHLQTAEKIAKSVEALHKELSDYVGKVRESDDTAQVDFAVMERLTETLTQRIKEMKEATKAAAELSQKISEAVKGVEIGELTQLTVEQGQEALAKAQHAEEKAEEQLLMLNKAIDRIIQLDKINEIDDTEVFFDSHESHYGQDAEEQLQIIKDAKTEIETLGGYLDETMHETDPGRIEALRVLAKDENAYLQKITGAINQLILIYETVSQTAKKDPDDPTLAAWNNKVKNTLDDARGLESQAKKTCVAVEQAISTVSTNKGFSEVRKEQEHGFHHPEIVEESSRKVVGGNEP